MENQNIITTSQYRFLKGKGTSKALVNLVTLINTALTTNKTTCGCVS